MRTIFRNVKFLMLGWILLGGIAFAFAEKTNVLVVADFESYPNNLGGSVGVFGAGEPNWEDDSVPHSWYYGELEPNFNEQNIFKGGQSFMCANGFSKEKLRWATFSLGLGKLVDTESVPIKIESLDVRGFNYLIFWVKGERGGEKFTVAFRDAHAINDLPQVTLNPMPEGARAKWQKIVVPLKPLANKIDLSQLDQVILEFGLNRGNEEGNVFYIDNFYFSKDKSEELE